MVDIPDSSLFFIPQGNALKGKSRFCSVGILSFISVPHFVKGTTEENYCSLQYFPFDWQ